MAQTINVLISSFPGLSVPPTLSIPLPAASTIADLTEQISLRLPRSLSSDPAPLILTTTNNRQLRLDSTERLGSLILCAGHAEQSSTFLPLRLGARLCGGKGGFGSQLRAAGGRMSSRRKGNQEENNGSSRNLDGRRLRTVKEAKALAEYLAIKPDMDKKEKEARRKRWEMVVEAAERRQEELRNGEGKGKVDGAWMEDKEEVSDKTRDAVLNAMKAGNWRDNLAGALVGGSSSSASDGSGGGGSLDESEDSEMEEVAAKEAVEARAEAPPNLLPKPPRKFFGFDDDEDDDEFMSDEDEDDVKGKGKAKAQTYKRCHIPYAQYNDK